MKTDLRVPRLLATRLPSPRGKRRLVVVTGARQTGKTTLARKVYAGLRFLNLDSIELRESVRGVRTAHWAQEIGPAVLDEAQKEPGVFDKVKYAFDDGSLDFTVLLGSSRILLLGKVRESLAGRAFLYDLWPLAASELACASAAEVTPPLLATLLRDLRAASARLAEVPAVDLDGRGETARAALDHLGLWGGMPALLPLDDDERREWLSAYQQSYLERDLTDLASLSDLLPFRTLQRLAMLRTASLVNYAELARDAGISASTARRYLEYLRLTYQALLIPPYRTNLTSRLVKTPKLFWTDLGLLRHATRQWGPLDGRLFETLVVSEIVKWISTATVGVDVSFYRTRSGLEVDLLLEGEGVVFGLEVKHRQQPAPRDLGPLRQVAGALGDRWAGGAVVTTGDRVDCLDPDFQIWAVPAHRLLG